MRLGDDVISLGEGVRSHGEGDMAICVAVGDGGSGVKGDGEGVP